LSKQSEKFAIKDAEKNIDFGNVPETTKLCYEPIFLSEANVVYVHNFGEERFGIVLDKTPFFAESGGQIGDSGSILNEHAEFVVQKTYMVNSCVVHEGTFVNGEFTIGEKVTAEITQLRREQIRAHHSAAHILQASLRNVLGQHVMQKGSLIEDSRLRFDFTHHRALSNEEKSAVESEVNSIILAALPCETTVCAKDDVKDALAFFDEKYGANVRVVQIGKQQNGKYFSKELCGGTHVMNTGQIGTFKILSECGIAAGVRRIEATCGRELLRWIDRTQEKANNEIINLKNEYKLLQKQLKESLNSNQSIDVTKEIIGNIELTICKIQQLSTAQQIRHIAETSREKLTTGIVVVVGMIDDKNITVAAGVAENAEDKCTSMLSSELLEKGTERRDGCGCKNACEHSISESMNKKADFEE
jgi:alanyl-tRNA synthetase